MAHDVLHPPLGYRWHNQISHVSCQTDESTNIVCRECDSSNKFKGNKWTYLTPLFSVIYAVI